MAKRLLSFAFSLALLFSLFGCQISPPYPTYETTAPTESTKPTQPTEPQPTEPQPTEPQPTEPQPTEPQPTEPQPTEPQPTEPQPTEPQPTEPPVEEPELWVPICNEYIYLRNKPYGDVICIVPVNSTLTVHSWNEIYAYVTYDGKQGYVPSSYIRPANDNFFTKRLDVVTIEAVYSYEQMLVDIATLQVLYPDTLRTGSIGYSELGRSIPVLQLGSPDAKYHVLLQGAMHAREHFTACLLMALADNALKNGIAPDVCYHIIPMVNPDGVVISQTGVLNSNQTSIYWNDVVSGNTNYVISKYAEQWKANGLGVDLNANFPAGWEPSQKRPIPSSEGFRGTQPFSAAETQALRDYTLQYPFSTTFSFHSVGSVIYYQYGNRQDVIRLSYSLALAAQAVTGYIPTWYDGGSGLGYKDWAINSLGIPSLTIEIGSYDSPLADREIYSTFARFEGFLTAIAEWMRKNV